MSSPTMPLSACLLLLAVLPTARGQAPFAGNRAVVGMAPNVEIRTSANATIDVGPTGLLKPDLLGSNLRATLGASSEQAISKPIRPLKSVGVPGYSFLSPTLVAGSLGEPASGKPAADQSLALNELVLPRFRPATQTNQSTMAPTLGADAWRYRYHRGQWWYWRPDHTWAVWNGSVWTSLK